MMLNGFSGSERWKCDARPGKWIMHITLSWHHHQFSDSALLAANIQSEIIHSSLLTLWRIKMVSAINKRHRALGNGKRVLVKGDAFLCLHWKRLKEISSRRRCPLNLIEFPRAGDVNSTRHASKRIISRYHLAESKHLNQNSLKREKKVQTTQRRSFGREFTISSANKSSSRHGKESEAERMT